jgi:hypothetical protein
MTDDAIALAIARSEAEIARDDAFVAEMDCLARQLGITKRTLITDIVELARSGELAEYAEMLWDLLCVPVEVPDEIVEDWKRAQ